LVAPANRVGDVLVGATTSLVFCLTLFTFFWGPYLVFGKAVAGAWADIEILARAGTDPDVLTQHYPDLQDVPTAQRGNRLAKKILADVTAQIPSSIWIGMLISLACAFVGPLMARWGGEQARGGARPSAALTADWNDWMLLVLTILAYMVLLAIFVPSLVVRKVTMWLVWFVAAYTLAKAWGLEDALSGKKGVKASWLLSATWGAIVVYVFVSWFFIKALWIDLVVYVAAFPIIVFACWKERQALQAAAQSIR
jgi:hypothetical protein